MIGPEENLLIHRAVDGSLEPDDLVALEALLAGNDEALKLYCRLVGIHGFLEYYSQIERQMPAGLRLKQEVEKRARRRKYKWGTVILAAAALLIFGFVWKSEDQQPADAIAEFRISADGEWSVERKSSGSGNTLRAGDRFTLGKGLADLRFNNGAQVVVEAPSTFVLAGSRRMVMPTGRAYFDTPAGFVVETAAFRIEDGGSRFAVCALAGRAAEVHAFRQPLSVYRLDARNPVATIVRPGEAVRDIAGSGSFLNLPAQSSVFHLELSKRPKFLQVDLDSIDPDRSFRVTGTEPEAVATAVGGTAGHIKRADGKVNGCVEFDGSGSHLSIKGWNGVSAMVPGTIAFWVKCDPTVPGSSRNGQCLLSWGGQSDPNRRWEISIGPAHTDSPGAIRVSSDDGQFLSGGINIADGIWHHLAVVLDPIGDGSTDLNASIHIDGKPDAAGVKLRASGESMKTGEILVGGQAGPSALLQSPFTGCIDELFIFRAALSGAEITQLSENPIEAAGE